MLRKLLLFGTLLLAGCGSAPEKTANLPFYRDSTLTPEWISSDSLREISVHRIDPFSLTDQNGSAVTQEEMNGKISVVDFFFTTCPSLCPKLTRSMLRIQDSLRRDSNVRLFSYSVTPETDSVPVLKAYALANGIPEGQWHLLTGAKADIYALARRSFFARIDTGAAAFLHTETFYLIDGERRIRGIYNGTLGAEIVQLIGDARRLSRES